jgi:oligopeptide transport system substrate-binding protein
MKKGINATLLCITGLLILLICGCKKETDLNNTKGKQPTVTFNLRSEGRTIDPQLQTSESSSKIDGMCMEGLVSAGKTSDSIIPGIAEKWKISKDKKTWTFFLRKNAKWSNGTPVTANDFVFAFKRALKPETGAQYAYLLYNILNAKNYNTGKIRDFAKVGIKAISNNILEINLNTGIPYFKQILTMPICYPLDEDFYNTVKKQYALKANKMLYNGPYKIKKWIPNGIYEFIKNPYYWNSKNIHIEKLNFVMVDNYNTAANMYMSNELDMCMITGKQLPQFKKNSALHVVDAGGIWYLQFNTENKFFKNRKIREAVSLAINRSIFCKYIRKDDSIPARAFVSPEITGGKVNNKNITFRKRFGVAYYKNDIIKAKKLYKEGLKELGIKDPVKIKLLCGTQNSSRRDCQFIQQQLFKNLGIHVTLNPNTFQGRLQKMNHQNYDFVYAGWAPDFNDPINFLDLWVTKGGNNHTGFSNKQYDNLINMANTNPDNKIRMKALHNAEKILMRKLPVTPLYYPVRLWLIKPWLKDVAIRATGIEISFNWAYIQK